jgi:hypothetical protein
VPAAAGGLDTHRDPITSRCWQASRRSQHLWGESLKTAANPVGMYIGINGTHLEITAAGPAAGDRSFFMIRTEAVTEIPLHFGSFHRRFGS